jgi:hypothetical protein
MSKRNPASKRKPVIDYPVFTLVNVRNDNAPHDPVDYEDFDPSQLPDDLTFSDDTPLSSLDVMALFAGFKLN